MKILICVLSSDIKPWGDLIEGIKNTWGSVKYENINIIYYFGNNSNNTDKPLLIKDNLYLPYEETFDNIGRKTIATFEFALNNYEFDYIIRPNASTYVDLDILYKYLVDKPRTNFVGGVLGDAPGISRFISGSCYVLSRDVVSMIIDNKEKWDHRYLDDVAMGKLIYSFPSVSIQAIGRIGHINPYNEKNIYIDKNIYNYRCKCPNREDDLKTFNRLHFLFKNT